MSIHSQEIGRLGEDIAENYFKKNKYKIIGRNIRIRKDEIDLIVFKKKTTVFVEVKTRQENPLFRAEDALNQSKLKNFKRAILRYCLTNNINPEDIRPDFLAINLGLDKKKIDIQHFKDIF